MDRIKYVLHTHEVDEKRLTHSREGGAKPHTHPAGIGEAPLFPENSLFPKNSLRHEINLKWEEPTFRTEEPEAFLLQEFPTPYGAVNVTEYVSFNGYDKGRSTALVVYEEEDTKYLGLHSFYWEAYVVEVGADNTKTKIMDLHPKTIVELSSIKPDSIREEALKFAEDWYFANTIALAGLVLM